MCFRHCQGTQVKDVIIKPDAPGALLLDKHADYIAAYGSKKDDYVSNVSFGCVTLCVCFCSRAVSFLFELEEKLNAAVYTRRFRQKKKTDRQSLVLVWSVQSLKLIPIQSL